VIGPPDLPEDFEVELILADEPSAERQLLSETNRAYAALKANLYAWQDERRERALWDGTLVDGLESERQDS
jgi:hypothetical protein